MNKQTRATRQIKAPIDFPDECPAFLLIDSGFIMQSNESGEIVEGTFNDQGSMLVLGFARVEKWWGTDQRRTPYFSAPAGPQGTEPPAKWWGAWHFTGRLRPLTPAAREMYALCNDLAEKV